MGWSKVMKQRDRRVSPGRGSTSCQRISNEMSPNLTNSGVASKEPTLRDGVVFES